MTLLVRRRALLLILILVSIATFAVGVTGYLSIRALAADDAIGKAGAERVLFVGLIATAFVISVCVTTLVRSFRLSVLLDRLVAMNRLSGYSAEVALRRLGDVGERIADLYAQTVRLSDLKSQKIASLTILNDYLMTIMSELVIVADATGRVVQASKPILDRLGKTRSEVVGEHVDSLIPGAETGAAIREMDRSHVSVVRERRGDSVVLSPVIDREGNVSYVTVVLARTVTTEMTRAAAPVPSSKAKPRRSLLARFFKRRADG
jgi:PAS domain-containing protein